MATNYTANYQLNQWESSDQVLRTEFNADNSKIDAALKANADAVTAEAAARAAALGQKADQSALNSLSQTVSALSQTAAGKADQSALNSLSQTVTALSQTVAGKADQSALNSVNQTVAGHTAAIAKLGSCHFYHTSYVGTGQMGVNNPTSLTFPHKPYAVLISCSHYGSLLLRGTAQALVLTNGVVVDDPMVAVTWTEKGVSCYAEDPTHYYSDYQCNLSGVTYQVTALLDMAQ